jgi:glycosyltransferase involved in cell wall biosynthesis
MDNYTQTRPAIVVAGDGIAPTGFARVVHGILVHLTETFDVHHIAHNFNGKPPEDVGWKVYPGGAENLDDIIKKAIEVIQRVRPCIVFLINDFPVCARMLKAFSQTDNFQDYKVVIYSPVDGGPIHPSRLEHLDLADRIVTYTIFGKKEMEKAFSLRNKDNKNITTPRIDIIPPGVDTEKFFPVQGDIHRRLEDRDKERCKEELFRGWKELVKPFIVLNANRNQPRKRIDLTIQGFALFARDKPENVKLYLHMGVKDLGWDIIQLVQRYDIEKRLILSTTKMHMTNLPYHRLNLVYNLCDVGVNTCFGEGWGLVHFEHAATGAVQVVPNHSAFTELWHEAGILMEPGLSLHELHSLQEEKYILPETLAQALETLYRDRDYLKEMSMASYKNATKPEYSWSHIAAQWAGIFKELL